MRLVRYDRRVQQVWLGGQRLHHGTTGVVLTALGILLMLHDRKDAPLWFARERLP